MVHRHVQETRFLVAGMMFQEGGEMTAVQNVQALLVGIQPQRI